MTVLTILCVFRVIGLCLLQNEIIPLYLCRHVLKYILGRPVGWHDLAFFDPVMYESFREVVQESKKENKDMMFSALDLTFCVELWPEEVCTGSCMSGKHKTHSQGRDNVTSHIYVLCLVYYQGGEQVELIPGGADMEVNSSNVYDYIRKYAQYRMVKASEKALEV